MKKSLFVILMLAVSPVLACDFCNGYLGLDPGFNKNTIGFRSSFQKASLELPAGTGMRTLHASHGGGSGDNGESVDQYFTGLELFARIYPIKKMQLIVSMPFQINTISSGNKTETRSAFSDMTLLGYYQLYNTMVADSGKIRHRIFGGLGVKFPTGKSSGTNEIDIPLAHDLYSGSGSTDYLFALTYIGKYNKLGWNVDINYKINGESSNDYKYGNSANVTPRIFYESRISSLTLLPHLGAAWENGGKDQYFKKDQEETGGSVIWGSGGLDFYYGKFSLTTEARLPFYHSTTDVMPEAKYWLFTAINFHF